MIYMFILMGYLAFIVGLILDINDYNKAAKASMKTSLCFTAIAVFSVLISFLLQFV